MRIERRYTSNGPILIQPDIFEDERGYFYESFNDEWFKKNICDRPFVQDNQSKSHFGVIRGIHFQKPPYAQAKLVRVVQGEVIDFAVDLREGPNYRKVYSAWLSGENRRQFYIPRGFGHAFLCLRDNTIFQYKVDAPYNKESEGGFNYMDPQIRIDWLQYIDLKDIIISNKDKQLPYTCEENFKFPNE